MVTHEQLRDWLYRKPFAPFRVTLTTGEHYDVTRLNQAVAMKRQLIYGDDTTQHFRWIRLELIDRVDQLEAVPN